MRRDHRSELAINATFRRLLRAQRQWLFQRDARLAAVVIAFPDPPSPGGPRVWKIARSTHHASSDTDAVAPSTRRDRLRTLIAQFEEPNQNLIPLGFELLDGARSDFGMDAVDELLPHARKGRDGAARF